MLAGITLSPDVELGDLSDAAPVPHPREPAASNHASGTRRADRPLRTTRFAHTVSLASDPRGSLDLTSSESRLAASSTATVRSP